MTDTNSSLEKAKAATRNRLVFLVASAILIPVLVVAAVELSLRIANVGFSTELLTPCTVQGHPAACYNLFFAAPFFPPGMIQTPRPYSIPAVKEERTYRIFVIGESAAMGDPDPAYGFSRYLEIMLRQRYPTTKFEVVNTGSVAINSHVSLLIAKGLATYKPDLFIIYSGNNEVVGPYGPGTTLASSWGMQLPIIRTSMRIQSTRIGQLVKQTTTPKTQWRGMELFLDKQIRADSPLLKYAYGNFEQNLRDTIAVARKSGARVVISTVATNIKDCAPFGSLHREDLSPADLQTWSGNFQKGAELESAGSYEDAMKFYRSAETLDGNYAELQFRIARCLRAIGDYPAAGERFSRARDLDTLRFRADSRINEINRSVASSIRGTELVDANSILADASADKIIGSDLVYEHVHLTPLGNYLLARAMFLQIASKLPAENAPTLAADTVPSESECEQWLALTNYDRARLAAEMLSRIGKPPFTSQVNHAEQVARLEAQLQSSQEDPYITAAQYQWALARTLDDRMLHYRFGMFLYEHRSMAAIDQLRMAQPWDGFPVMTPDGQRIQ